tara:strand:+ start:498 stop:1748 length:1251 start_codon:yes stop_codon:yes gene_type:complete
MKKIIKIQITYVDFEEDYNALENSILSSELGVYAGVVGGYGNRGAQFEVFENINDQKYDRDYFSNSVSTLYRLPFLTLSRDKLANFKDECKFNVIRDRDKADIVVIGENTMSKMTETTYKNVFEYKDWKSVVLEKMIYANLEQNDKNYIINFINSIADDHGENVYISFNTNHYYYSDDDKTDREKNLNKFLQMIQDTREHGCKSVSENQYTTYVKKDSLDLYNWIYNNQNNLIKDTVLNKLCVQNSVTLGVTEFEQLNNLISSSDEENVNIGLTMMANCNVEDSKLYLSLLFANHSENMKGRKVWNHVNFKYLRKIFERYINLTLSNWGGAYNNLLESLVNDNCLTMWGSRYIANLMFTRVIESHLGVGTKDCVFTVSVDDLKLKSVYEDQLVDDNDNKLSELLTETGVGHDDLPF